MQNRIGLTSLILFGPANEWLLFQGRPRAPGGDTALDEVQGELEL